MPGSELQKKHMGKKIRGYKKRQNLFAKRSCENLSVLKASNKITLVLAEKHKPSSDGEDIVKSCLHKIIKWVGDKSIERKVNKIALSRQLHDTFTSCLMMSLSNRRIVSTHAPFH